MWEEAIQITVACVLAVQMGLVKAIGDVIHYESRILSCPRCATFWLSLGIHLLHSRPALDAVFVSFLSSYAAMWLCLIYDLLATFYNHVYEEIQGEEAQENADAAEAESSADAMSEL